MSDESQTAEVIPIHEGLKAFVESAIADTAGLTSEQGDSIRERLQYWYEYYGKYLSFMPLDFADNEVTKWEHEFFRRTLNWFVEGSDTLEHVYYAVPAFMAGFYNEWIRIAVEERLRKERAEEEGLSFTETREPNRTQSIAATPTEITDKPQEIKRPQASKRTGINTPKPRAQSAQEEQFSLFG